jgi:hypothetical protein
MKKERAKSEDFPKVVSKYATCNKKIIRMLIGSLGH